MFTHDIKEQYDQTGITGVLALDIDKELRTVQKYVYEVTCDWLEEHDPRLSLKEKLRVPFAGGLSNQDWSTLMKQMNTSSDSPIPNLVRAPAVIESFRTLYGEEPQEFPICKFRAIVAGNQRSQYNWHQDQGTWFVTRFKELAEAMPATLWLSVNGATQHNSVEFALKSHALPLLNHRFVTGQGLFNADAGQYVDRFETWKAEVDPGNGVIFHPLLLHRTIVPTTRIPRYSVDIRYSRTTPSPKHDTHWKFLLRRIWAGIKPSPSSQ